MNVSERHKFLADFLKSRFGGGQVWTCEDVNKNIGGPCHTVWLPGKQKQVWLNTDEEVFDWIKSFKPKNPVLFRKF